MRFIDRTNTWSHLQRCYVLLSLFTQSFHIVSLQEIVVGYRREAVVLSCIHKEISLETQDVVIFWRFKDRAKVHDVIRGVDHLSRQHMGYKNRTHTFPSEYSKGNFSLFLENLRDSDSGRYACFLPPMNIHRQIDLVVKDRPVPEYHAEASSGLRRIPWKLLLLFLLGQICLLQH